MNEQTARCVICTGERAAHVGLMCGGHHQRLADMLREVEEQAAILSAVPSMQQRTGSGKGSLASERAPARLDVLVHLDPRSRPAGTRYPGPACPSCWHDSCTDIRNWLDAYDARATDTLAVLDVLGSWARLVREERSYADRTAATVTTERAYLTRNLDWCAEQDWIDEFYGDVRTLVGQLKAANGTAELRKKPVGICPTLYEEGECGGRLWPDEARGEVMCGTCDRTFTPEELRHLGDMLIRQGYVEVFRAEWFTGVPAGTIRRWVSEGRCTSEKSGRKLMVQVSEIERLHKARKQKRVAS